jgi:hypothetical protein
MEQVQAEQAREQAEASDVVAAVEEWTARDLGQVENVSVLNVAIGLPTRLAHLAMI